MTKITRTKALVLLVSLLLGASDAFTTTTPSSFGGVTTMKQQERSTTTSRLFMIGPLQKFTDKEEYEKTVENLMAYKNLSREEAEKEYDSFLENPNNYALSKGEDYYKSLGYNSLMDGVIGEAEKEGRGEEVKERIAEFKRQSKIKALSVISVFFAAIVYGKITYVPPPH
eukprot:CAMPEP_0194050102 /NCGR_PEP_ID=MMETSP0009_2-20130614/33077_1 /TAXON_ID=210454 /ORGANISM="Grammatophora oceanica, Strain CCMP 410" /LENGTH=169 /DNA_ID=CAMNT_0038696513 /DNA_START=60 /DNA_END=569 /DNA_ORIENTATION=+